MYAVIELLMVAFVGRKQKYKWNIMTLLNAYFVYLWNSFLFTVGYKLIPEKDS